MGILKHQNEREKHLNLEFLVWRHMIHISNFSCELSYSKTITNINCTQIILLSIAKLNRCLYFTEAHLSCPWRRRTGRTGRTFSINTREKRIVVSRDMLWQTNLQQMWNTYNFGGNKANKRSWQLIFVTSVLYIDAHHHHRTETFHTSVYSP